MLMTSKERVLKREKDNAKIEGRAQGKADALDLAGRAATMDGTAIIAEENHIPMFKGTVDYTNVPVGAPVADEGQVWLLLQPHNAAHHDGRPSTLRALWGLAHTKDPKKAKAWVDAYGTSGMYMTDECYKDAEGNVYRALQDNLVYDAATLPSAWELVEENNTSEIIS